MIKKAHVGATTLRLVHVSTFTILSILYAQVRVKMRITTIYGINLKMLLISKARFFFFRGMYEGSHMKASSISVLSLINCVMKSPKMVWCFSVLYFVAVSPRNTRTQQHGLDELALMPVPQFVGNCCQVNTSQYVSSRWSAPHGQLAFRLCLTDVESVLT